MPEQTLRPRVQRQVKRSFDVLHEDMPDLTFCRGFSFFMQEDVMWALSLRLGPEIKGPKVHWGLWSHNQHLGFRLERGFVTQV